tara:strand:+ start:1582 stop:2169 length:588 start_codon:yes stop_codon:yes gene_type:complete
MMKNGDHINYIKGIANYVKRLLSGQVEPEQKASYEQCLTKTAKPVSKNPSVFKIGLILFGALVVSRLLPLPPNSEPLLGLAVITPYLTKNNLAFLLPLAVMFVSDLFIGFHNSMLMTYSALALAPFISRTLDSKYMSLLSSWLVWHVMANAGQWFPPFSPEALLFDIRFLISGLAIVVLFDLVQKYTSTALQYNK